MSLEPWQQRVIDERVGLENRIDNLQTLLNGPHRLDVADPERRLLRAQLSAMHEYHYVLTQRIDNWS